MPRATLRSWVTDEERGHHYDPGVFFVCAGAIGIVLSSWFPPNNMTKPRMRIMFNNGMMGVFSTHSSEMHNTWLIFTSSHETQ